MKVRKLNSTEADKALGKWPQYQHTPLKTLSGDAVAVTLVSAVHRAAKAILSTERMEPQFHQGHTTETIHWLQGFYTEPPSTDRKSVV